LALASLLLMTSTSLYWFAKGIESWFAISKY
jgi:hypothetical protein